MSVLVTVLGQPAAPGTLPAFQRATVVLAAVAFSAGLVDLLLIPARSRERSGHREHREPSGHKGLSERDQCPE